MAGAKIRKSTLVTYVVTVESRYQDLVENSLREAIKFSGARMPGPKWSPDNDTISEAYGDSEHTTVVLNG